MMVGATNTVIGIVLFAIVAAARPARADATSVVERIYIRGNVRTRDKTIRREIGVVEAGPVQMANLEHVRNRLDALSLFTRIAVSMRPGSSRGLVTLHIDVTERPSARGAGFASLESFIAVCTMSQVTTRSQR
jgi:outer membrane protein insertion porin family